MDYIEVSAKPGTKAHQMLRRACERCLGDPEFVAYYRRSTGSQLGLEEQADGELQEELVAFMQFVADTVWKAWLELEVQIEAQRQRHYAN